MDRKLKARRGSSKKRMLPPGSVTTPIPFWWPEQVPWYMAPQGISAETWWRMCKKAIQDAYDSVTA